MEPVTVRFPAEQLEELKQLVEDGVYPTISEAVRDGARNLVEKQPRREVRPDGGVTARRPPASKQSDRWEQLAKRNLERWGVQDVDVVLLAIQEELGELTQAYLEYRHEGGPRDRVAQELNDLAPLLFQLELSIRRGKDGT